MTLPRRTFLHLTASAVALPAVSRFAWAETRPLRIVVGMAPGSAADIMAGLLGQILSDRLGRDVVIDHQLGVGGNIAAQAVVDAEPDGHTLLLVGPSSAINATLYDRLGFNFLRDIAPVAGLAHSANIMAVSPSLSVRTVADLIALANANPGTIKFASAGVGTATHLSGELFRTMTGIDMVHVPCRGGGNGAFADLLAGKVDVYFPPLASATGYIERNELRALAVTSTQRGTLGLPAVADTVPGYASSTWFGVGAPKNTPAAIVRTLNQAINAGLADPTTQAQLAGLGATALAGSPADFGRLVATETDTWAKVIPLADAALS